MTRSHRFHFAFLLATSSAITSTMPARAETGADAAFDFDINAQSLSTSLGMLGRVTGLEILYPSELVAGRRASALKGHMSADTALARLLSGTHLKVVSLSAGVVTLTLQRPRSSRSKAVQTPRQPSSLSPATSTNAQTGNQEILVTGSHIRGEQAVAAPLTVIDDAQLARSGRTTVADALSTLPQNFGGTATESTLLSSSDRKTDNSGASSSINLRGLGSNATLTLIDGRRVAGAGGDGDFTDLSAIPMLAVDRIEVLADGASALYGADAVGGVVNIKLRKQFNGAETQLRVGQVTSGSSREIDGGQLFGRSWSTGHVIVAYEYYHRDRLKSADRAFARSDDLTTLGGQDFRSYYSIPATVLGYDPVAGGFVPTFAVPDGQDGTSLTPASFQPGQNRQNDQLSTDLLPRQTRNTAYFAINQQVNDWLSLNADMRGSSRKFAYDTEPSLALFVVTPADPYFVSPDAAAADILTYSFARELGPVRNTGSVSDLSGALGATVKPGGSWEITTYASRSDEWTHFYSDQITNTQRLDEALGNAPPAGGFDPAIDGYFNPYGSGASNNPAILDFVGSGYVGGKVHSATTSVDAYADGGLFTLPGGVVRAAVGVSWRHDILSSDHQTFLFTDLPTAGPSLDANRSVTAEYVELSVPLIGKDNAILGVQKLAVSAAARREHHSDYGNTINPKLGLSWEPYEGLQFGGTYGTSFRAPSLREVNAPLEVSPTQLSNAAGGYTPVLFLTGGNTTLKAEKATSWTTSAAFSPSFDKSFHAELTYFQTRFTNRIGDPSYENITVALIDPTLQSFVTPVSPGTNAADLAKVEALIATPGTDVPPSIPPSYFQAIVDGRYVNTAELLVHGLDASVSQGFRVFGGRAEAAASVSYLLDYKERQTAAGPLVNRVNTPNYPAAFRGEASLDWSGHRWGGTVSVHHVGGYEDPLSTPERKVQSWTTCDLQLRWTPPGLRGAAHGLTVAFNVQNLTDAAPPFLNRSQPTGYDPANADPLGRFVSLQMTKAW